MHHADGLCRNTVNMLLQNNFTSKIILSQNTDEHIQAIKKMLKTKSYENYIIKNKVIWKCDSGQIFIVVPDEM